MYIVHVWTKSKINYDFITNTPNCTQLNPGGGIFFFTSSFVIQYIILKNQKHAQIPTAEVV